ncbi:MAG: 3-hydroxyacyl-CoA dehydrogenase [Deltaproteobacteria bacterium]|nr:MAG: 3-hydroxyacyl-CoA dehydrogenase [Deltaproteobacteria bacterium]
MQIERIVVVGAGIMGRGIAHVAALGGFQTFLYDISPEILEDAHARIEADLDQGIERGKITPQAKTEALARLSLETDLDRIAPHADLVIEAVPERIELKLDLFTRLDRSCRPEVILASNTSGLSITEMAAATERPQRVIGMHFFNPVHKMKLVEIVKGLETAPETVATIGKVAARMGKESVEVRESPGFVTSRINALIGNEAFYMLEAGVATARDIDKALKLGLNHPMGPFELVDLVGLDTRLAVLQHLHATLGEKYRPCPLIEQYVRAGRLGRKTGRGVYDYRNES